MRLIKLELIGFKSFARKTELMFSPGITAVIGPNGSGKSNIADAVRWVLGEQSAKALRGAKMEDVIFNGTQERKPQSYCEVTLTFDNSDGALPLEFSEVTITRRVYRSGESEYSVNRNTCRLKDIYELFRDTGIGREGYSIIGQGRVDEILSNRSNERRTALEEAAGVTRYRVRKEESLRKLEHTKKNLERLEDILMELDAQREPLFEQAEKARAYLALRDELKDLELNVFIHQYERVQERLKSVSEAIEAIELERGQIEKDAMELSGSCLEEEEELKEIEKRLSSLQANLFSEVTQLEAHIGEAGILKERKENIELEYERISGEIKESEQKRDELEAQLNTGDNDGGKDMLILLDGEIQEAEAEAAKLNQAIAEQENLVEQQKSSIIESLNRISDAKSQLSRMDAMSAALNQRLDVINEERQAAAFEHEGLVKEREQARSDWEAMLNDRRSLDAALIEGKRQTAKAKEALAKKESLGKSLEQKLNAMRSRVNVLEEMSRAHEGYYTSVRSVLRDCDRDRELKSHVLGVVAELISVPEELETAIEMALGNGLQDIVTPTAESAKVVIAHLRSRQYGRATFLPVSDMRPRNLSRDERECLNMPGCLGVASELISFDGQYRNIAEYLLGRTVIVNNIEAGIAINRRARSSFRIATLDGDIINPGGSMTGGSVQKREFSLLGRERECKQLRVDINSAEGQLQRFSKELNEAKEAVRQSEDACAALEAQQHLSEIEHARHKEKAELIERDIQQSDQKLLRADHERERILDNLADIEKDRLGMEQVRSGIEKGSAATQEDVLQSQHKLSALRKTSEAMNAALTERKVRRMALQKEEDAFAQERKRITREFEKTKQAIEDASLALLRNKDRSDDVNERIEKLGAKICEEQALVETRKEEQRRIEEEKETLLLTLSASRKSKDEFNDALRELSERKHKQELLQSRAELEFTSIQERIMTDYSMAYEDALLFRRQPFGVTAAHVRIDGLRAEIRELGNINVNAVEDYEVLKERCANLREQCEDLTKAEADLNTLIDELTRTMEKQFIDKFTAIQKNFTSVFAQLFDGGYAELRLSEPKDPLNCDIDIIAQPPGKKLQLLTLLSGGERALTAIALLFAMLRLKPTVFCILDEIETSLDEVNVTRFAHYLRNYADDTQFILITHRKGSMEVCDALYGVAMEERGVSRLVSARFTGGEDREGQRISAS